MASPPPARAATTPAGFGSIRSAASLGELERLVAAGAITGYTVEPAPRYLTAGVPVLTCSMYRGCPVSGRNLRLLAMELTEAGARVELVARRGTCRWDGAVQRTLETTAIAWFSREGDLLRGVSVIRARYIAGTASAVPGSWTLPDVRVCGVRVPGLVSVKAHLLDLAPSAAAVVLDVADDPPVPRMRTRPVDVLPTWAYYLTCYG